MIPVDQTRFGAFSDLPVEERGNCHAAALASVLELPLKQMPSVPYDDEYRNRWNAWLVEQGIAEITVTLGEDCPPPKGYTLGVVRSRVNPDGWHSVVCKDGSPVHDPNPRNAGNPYTLDEVDSYTIIYPVDPARIGVLV